MSEAVRSPLRTALVFAGGGSLGAIQVGMMKALVAARIQVDLLVGASVGAINAAYLALRGLQAIDDLELVWRQIRRRDVFPLGLVQALLGLLSFRSSLVTPNALRSLLERQIGSHRFEDTRRPLFIVATDVDDGAEAILSHGQLVPALLASAAIPGVFPPVRIGSRTLIDGGVTNNTPISVAVQLGAERIIVLPTGAPCSCERLPRGAVFLAVHALNISIARQLAVDVARFAGRAEVIVVPPLCPLDAAAYAFTHTDDLIVRAERRTREWMATGGFEAGDKSSPLAPHGPHCPCRLEPRPMRHARDGTRRVDWPPVW